MCANKYLILFCILGVVAVNEVNGLVTGTTLKAFVNLIKSIGRSKKEAINIVVIVPDYKTLAVLTKEVAMKLNTNFEFNVHNIAIRDIRATTNGNEAKNIIDKINFGTSAISLAADVISILPGASAPGQVIGAVSSAVSSVSGTVGSNLGPQEQQSYAKTVTQAISKVTGIFAAEMAIITIVFPNPGTPIIGTTSALVSAALDVLSWNL